MSREAENWAWNQTWCDGTDKLVLVAMCRLARVGTYSGGTHQIARLGGITPQTVKRSIRKFREVSQVTSPKRGTWVFPIANEVSPVIPHLETPNRKVSPSPKTPSISKDKGTKSTGAREEQQTFLEFPDWFAKLLEVTTTSGETPVTVENFPKLKAWAGRKGYSEITLEKAATYVDSAWAGQLKKRVKVYSTFQTAAMNEDKWSKEPPRNGARNVSGRAVGKPRVSTNDDDWREQRSALQTPS